MRAYRSAARNISGCETGIPTGVPDYRRSPKYLKNSGWGSKGVTKFFLGEVSCGSGKNYLLFFPGAGGSVRQNPYGAKSPASMSRDFSLAIAGRMNRKNSLVYCS